MRPIGPIGYRLNVEVSGIEELKEACKEVSKKAEELQEAIDRLSEIEVKVTADCVRSSKAEETTSYKANKRKRQMTHLDRLLDHAKYLKKNDFHSKIIISADGVYLEQTKEFHPLDETLLD